MGISATFKSYGGRIILGFGVVALVAALAVIFYLLTLLVPAGDGSLPLVAIGGVVVLILMLTAVAMIFSILELTNKDQAMGLPEGSIRAVIALSLIVLFAILSVFLYQNLAIGGSVNTIANLSEADRAQFLRDHPTARDVQSSLAKGGVALKNDDGTPKILYDLSYRSSNPVSDDFAKQLLVLLGTLMTAITSFYLGAGTATSAAKAGGETAVQAAVENPRPTMSGINPVTAAAANSPLKLEITGTNLNPVTHVKIVRDGVQVAAAKVASNPTSVTCEIPLDPATMPAGAPWDVVVDDGAAKSATLPGALTIT